VGRRGGQRLGTEEGLTDREGRGLEGNGDEGVASAKGVDCRH
jgi:hypothetical protein